MLETMKIGDKKTIESPIENTQMGEGGWMGDLKNLNKNLYVIPEFYLKRYQGYPK